MRVGQNGIVYGMSKVEWVYSMGRMSILGILTGQSGVTGQTKCMGRVSGLTGQTVLTGQAGYTIWVE